VIPKPKGEGALNYVSQYVSHAFWVVKFLV
jgi:hypothetical protein